MLSESNRKRSLDMANKLLGVGIGVFLIAAVWIVAFFLAYVFSKLRRPTSYIGSVGFLVATILTVILLCIPREKEGEEPQPFREHQDTMFIWRTAVLALMGLSLLLGGGVMISEHLAAPIAAKKLQNTQRGTIRLKVE